MNNVVALNGRLTSDPRPYNNLAYFTLAVRRNYKNQEGEYDTDFIDCVVFRDQAKFAVEHLHKGALTGVMGELNSRRTEDNRTRLNVNVRNIDLLEPRNKNKQRNDSQSSDPYEQRQSNDEYIDISSNDLPF